MAKKTLVEQISQKSLCPICERELENNTEYIRQHTKYCERVHGKSLVQLPIDEQLDEIDQILQTVLETIPLRKKGSISKKSTEEEKSPDKTLLRRTASTSSMVAVNSTFTSLLLLQQIASRHSLFFFSSLPFSNLLIISEHPL